MGLESEIHVSTISIPDIVLVQHIVETLIQVFQVEENHCSPCLHADLDLVNIPTHLCVQSHINFEYQWGLKQGHIQGGWWFS